MKVYKVTSARKPRPEHGILPGDSYYWWKFRDGGKQYSRDYPSQSQITSSPFLREVYALEEELAGIERASQLEDIIERARTLGEEVQESLENMPSQLQDGPSGQILQERVDAVDAWISELEEAFEEDSDAGVERAREMGSGL